uniref:Uncharacterized protein n=1 Tax=Timema poppense TaxID=170557 RepID=A0A7R9DV34_TIMPO|nr:unnamed protein product [Timema poppensis]
MVSVLSLYGLCSVPVWSLFCPCTVSICVPGSHLHLLSQVVQNVFIEPLHVVKKRSTDQPLRVLLHYDDSVYSSTGWLLVGVTSSSTGWLLVGVTSSSTGWLLVGVTSSSTGLLLVGVTSSSTGWLLVGVTSSLTGLLLVGVTSSLTGLLLVGVTSSLTDLLLVGISRTQGNWLDAEKFELINNTVLPEAVQFWERALMVRKTSSVIRLNR